MESFQWTWHIKLVVLLALRVPLVLRDQRVVLSAQQVHQALAVCRV